jgi:hypothetical protein
MKLVFVPESDYDDARPPMTFAPRSRGIGLDEFPKTRAGLVDQREMRELARRICSDVRLKDQVASTLREAKKQGVEMPSSREIEDVLLINCVPGSPLDKLYRETWGIPMNGTKPALITLNLREGVADDEDDADAADDAFCSQCGRNSKGELAPTEAGLVNFKGKKAPPFQREGALAIDFGAAERERVEGSHLREQMNPSLH